MKKEEPFKVILSKCPIILHLFLPFIQNYPLFFSSNSQTKLKEFYTVGVAFGDGLNSTLRLCLGVLRGRGGEEGLLKKEGRSGKTLGGLIFFIIQNSPNLMGF